MTRTRTKVYQRSAIVILSGGMDSATTLYLLAKEMDYHVKAISFDYSQYHVKELDAARAVAQTLGDRCEWQMVDLRHVGSLLSGSALTDAAIPVPEGHYTDESMKATVVPNRNMIMLSIAWGIGVANEVELIATGVHAGDHAIYPDCRPEFIDTANLTLRTATKGFGNPAMTLYAPFVYAPKSHIVKVGHGLGVPFEKTWSCYKGGLAHCGACGTCVERIEAFQIAGVKDPTTYEQYA